MTEKKTSNSVRQARPGASFESSLTQIRVPEPGRASLSDRLARGDLMAADCPSREVLKHVTSRWGVLVLIALEQRMHRFSELKRAIGGVSERMLAQTLQWLEADALVDRKAYQVVPPHVEYRLTPLGYECAEKVRLLADWIEVSLPRVQAASRAEKIV
jgi:DNA-binding HxlR family transcriptional regulator